MSETIHRLNEARALIFAARKIMTDLLIASAAAARKPCPTCGHVHSGENEVDDKVEDKRALYRAADSDLAAAYVALQIERQVEQSGGRDWSLRRKILLQQKGLKPHEA